MNNQNINKGLYKERFVKIAKLGILVFNADELANLWQITNRNSLRITLKRYVDEGLLIRIKNGLYSLVPAEKINIRLLGLKALHRYAYISAETVLSQKGIIFQNVPQITIVSSVSKKFSIGENQYYCRQLADKFLFNDAGIENENGILIASAERAAADILYFNSKYHFDAENLIDWNKVRSIQDQIGYPKILR